jgi:hypothetical protein
VFHLSIDPVDEDDEEEEVLENYRIDVEELLK